MVGGARVHDARRVHVQPRPGAEQFEREQGADAEAFERYPAAMHGLHRQHEDPALARLEVADVTLDLVEVQADAVP